MVGWAFLLPGHTEKGCEDSSPQRFLEALASSTSVKRQGAHLCPETPIP